MSMNVTHDVDSPTHDGLHDSYDDGDDNDDHDCSDDPMNMVLQCSV